MALDIIGKVQQILPQQSGIGKNGTSWSKREFVIETMEQFPRKVCISVWGDKADSLEQQYPVGTTVKAGINIESREYNGKWYTDVRAWRIDLATEEKAPDSFPPPPDIMAPSDTLDSGIGTIVDEEADDMLPF
ncbi:MAG: DUF3127 domain-containing protein [Bacteroidales bacterium]|jgi:hypothetical protein|nr:DUF3127 domain-containing protein [Bacteroidales bacterium]